MTHAPSVCVVVCYWTGRPARDLHRLLGQMRRVEPGAAFDLVVVCNGGDARPLRLPGRFDALRPRVVDRENSGYNLAAWDVGWRASPGYDHYLFLQDECFLKRPGWVGDFAFRMGRDAGVGLLGEAYMWERKTWAFIREATDRDLGRRAWAEGEPLHPIDGARAFMEARGLPLTETGEHLSSIILFTSRAVLEEVGGFPLIGPSYREACACEIGFSRLIASRGYRLSRVGDRDFSRIGHRQWTRAREVEMAVRGRARSALRAIGLGRRPAAAADPAGGGR